MAFTTAGKNFAMRSYNDNTTYIALAVDGTELVGHGYRRAPWSSGQKTLDETNSTLTNSADITAYTASDDTAQDANQGAHFDELTGGNQLTDWTTFTTDIDAPANGQSVVFRTGSISIDI